MDNSQPISPRRRLQTLLAIPDNQRSEAQWDEIVELEIQLAPGNREDGPGRDMRTVPAQPHRKPSRPETGGNTGNAGNSAPRHSKSPRKPRGKPNKPKPAPST